MSDVDNIAEELFFKLRNRFPKINMGDENGQVTTSPMESRFFNFKFSKEGRSYGLVTCSIIDNQSLKIYFSQDITDKMDDEVQDEWFQFLRELRKFAKTNMLTFDVRDIDKDSLSQRDIDFTSKYHKEKTAVQESKINWERHGRFSEGNHKSIKIHVVHKDRMDENPNNRLLGIDKIYLVNENKERFLLPFVSISGAKAMAMHCAQGGTPYDNDGTTITKAVAEMKNLSRFGMALRNKTFESEEPMKVVRASKHIKEQIKKNLARMAGARSFAEGMEGLRGLLATESTDKTEVLKDWFIQSSYDDKLDTWLESATNALRRCMEQNVNLNEEDDSALDITDHTDKRAANPAKIGSSVNLYADPRKDDEMRDLIKSQPMRGMIRLILADIATRAVDDETAILASKADEGEFTMQHKKMIEAYLKDLFGENPPRETPGPKKDLYGKHKSAEEEFEEEIMGIGEEDIMVDDEQDRFRDEIEADEEGLEAESVVREMEDETEESIGDRHKRERFKSLNKIKSRLGEQGCNHTMEGEMCPVHGIQECPSGGVSVVVGEEPMMEDLMKIRRLAGLVENYVYASEEEAAPAGEVPAGEVPAGEVPAGEAPAGEAPAGEAPAGDEAAEFSIDDWEKVEVLTNFYQEKGASEQEAQETAAQDLGFDPTMVANWAKENFDTEGGSEEDISKFGEAEQVADEGNEFSGALSKARAAHKDEFEVDGKKYKVKEGSKPDYIDADKDGNKTEPMKKAFKDREQRVGEAAKPDFLDVDKDGNKKEPMKKALKDKEKTDEALEQLKKAAGIW